MYLFDLEMEDLIKIAGAFTLPESISRERLLGLRNQGAPYRAEDGALGVSAQHTTRCDESRGRLVPEVLH
jgi:hypothetical protein